MLKSDVMKKILVHIHLFYVDQADFFIERLKNITEDFDLFITYVEESIEFKEKFKTFKSDVKLIKVENRGYDVLPFINVIKSVNLDDYDYVLKLHTKNKRTKIKLHGFKCTGYWWRNQLVNCIIGSKRRFKNVMKTFKDPKIGLICSRIFYWNTENIWPEDTYLLEQELNLLKFKTKSRSYCAGTMFIAKADIFKFLQNRQFKQEEFPSKCETNSGSTLAHVYERVLCIASNECGYQTHTINNPVEFFKLNCKNFLQLIFSIKNDKDEFGNKTKYICIFGKKISC